MKSIELPSTVAFGGYDGSGKDTIAETLRDKFTGVPVVGLGDILKDIATILEMDGDDREVRRNLSKQLAEKYHDPAIMAHLALGEYDEIDVEGKTIEFGDRYANKNGELYITSIRRFAEAEAIKKRGGTLLWIHTPIDVRYQRVLNRARGSGDEIKTFEEFVTKGEIEIYAKDPTDPNAVNVSRVFGAADFIYNNPNRPTEEMIEHIGQTFQLPRRFQ